MVGVSGNSATKALVAPAAPKAVWNAPVGGKHVRRRHISRDIRVGARDRDALNAVRSEHSVRGLPREV